MLETKELILAQASLYVNSYNPHVANKIVLGFYLELCLMNKILSFLLVFGIGSVEYLLMSSQEDYSVLLQETEFLRRIMNPTMGLLGVFVVAPMIRRIFQLQSKGTSAVFLPHPHREKEFLYTLQDVISRPYLPENMRIWKFIIILVGLVSSQLWLVPWTEKGIYQYFAQGTGSVHSNVPIPSFSSSHHTEANLPLGQILHTSLILTVWSGLLGSVWWYNTRSPDFVAISKFIGFCMALNLTILLIQATSIPVYSSFGTFYAMGGPILIIVLGWLCSLIVESSLQYQI